jgi:hypothetical protein
MNWDSNLGYKPFLYSGQSIIHTLDMEINFGLGDRIQLTFENAWLCVDSQQAPPKCGLGQEQLRLKWRSYEDEESGFAISVFPKFSLNNPNHSVRGESERKHRFPGLIGGGGKPVVLSSSTPRRVQVCPRLHCPFPSEIVSELAPLCKPR